MQSTDLDPIRDMTEDDVRRIDGLALDRPRVLSAICKAMSIYLTTSHYTNGEDNWTATPIDGSAFTGTMIQVIAYVRGYAVAWLGGRARYRALVAGTHAHMVDQLEKLR
jgi:hypothetical protein